MPDVSDNMVDQEKRKALIAKYGHKDFQVRIDSIEPEGGPTTGNTRVLVRGGPFFEMNIIFPKPKCKFGKHDMVVDATYVLCTASPTAIEDLEPRHRNKVRLPNCHHKFFEISNSNLLYRTKLAFNAIIVQ